MPYITQQARAELRSRRPQNKGELNYVITKLIMEYIEYKGLSYQNLSDAAAALSDCRDEFYRRIIAPYEDQAIQRNGDVF